MSKCAGKNLSLATKLWSIVAALSVLVWTQVSLACPPTTPPSWRVTLPRGAVVELWLHSDSRTPAPIGKRLEDCGWSRTEWQFVNDPKYFFDWDYTRYQTDFAYSKTIDRKIDQQRRNAVFWVSGPNRALKNPLVFSHTLGGLTGGQGLDWSTRYYVRARALTDLSVNGRGKPTVFWSSPYSKQHQFTTIDPPCKDLPQLSARSPSSQAKDVSITPTLKVESFDPLPKWPCHWEQTVLELQWAENGNMKTSTEEFSHYPRDPRHEISPGKQLLTDTLYRWRTRTRYKSRLGKWSPWDVFTTVKAPIPGPVPSPIVPGPTLACTTMPTAIPLGPLHRSRVADRSNVSVTIGFSDRGIGCQVDEIALQVVDDSNGSYIHQTGFIEAAGEAIIVPASVLISGGQYRWRAKLVDRGGAANGDDVFSDWTSYSNFSVQ